MSGENKCDKNEMSKRVRSAQDYILQGQFTCDIIKQLCIQYNITERQAYNIYNKAWNDIQKENEIEKNDKKAVYIQTLKKLYRDLNEKNTPTGARTATRIVESMARMDGIIPIRENQRGFSDERFYDVDDENGNGAIMKLPDGTEIEV